MFYHKVLHVTARFFTDFLNKMLWEWHIRTELQSWKLICRLFDLLDYFPPPPLYNITSFTKLHLGDFLLINIDLGGRWELFDVVRVLHDENLHT